jgi:hypothetical protein
MSGFHRPDAFLEPVEQRQVVSSATKYGLAKVNMGLNKTRKDRATGGVDDNVRRLAGFSYTRYAAVTD